MVTIQTKIELRVLAVYMHCISMERPMPNHRHTDPSPCREARLFRNNKSQAVRIPADFEFPGERVLIHREGTRLVIEPVPEKRLSAVLATLEPLPPEDAFPDIDRSLLPAKDVDL